jgi:hypothetical protein
MQQNDLFFSLLKILVRLVQTFAQWQFQRFRNKTVQAHGIRAMIRKKGL